MCSEVGPFDPSSEHRTRFGDGRVLSHAQGTRSADRADVSLIGASLTTIVSCRAWIVGVGLLSTACLFDVGSCVYELRTLNLTGALTTVEAPSGDARESRSLSASVTLDETRGDGPQRTLSFHVAGVSHATVAAVELHDAATRNGPPLAVFVRVYGDGTPDSHGEMQLGFGPPSRDDLVHLARDGRLRLVVLRLVDADPTLQATLAVSGLGDWIRPRCD